MLAALFGLFAVVASQPPRAAPTAVIETVMFAPIYHHVFACMDHPEGQLGAVGDALGADCMVQAFHRTSSDGGWYDTHRGDGLRNEDWAGWNEPVFAPIPGVVTRITVNPVVNRPGTMGRPPASAIAIRRDDGVVAVLAHLGSFDVHQGDRVAAGQQIGRVGNNGMARAPHVHVGAYRGLVPLQIRWDLKAEGRIPALVEN